LIAGIITGLSLAFSLLTYKGTEPLNVSLYLGGLVGTQLMLIFFLMLVLLISMFKRSSGHKSLLYSFLGSLLVKAIMTIRDSAMKKLSAVNRNSLEAAIGMAKREKNSVWGFVLTGLCL